MKKNVRLDGHSFFQVARAIVDLFDNNEKEDEGEKAKPRQVGEFVIQDDLFYSS